MENPNIFMLILTWGEDIDEGDNNLMREEWPTII